MKQKPPADLWKLSIDAGSDAAFWIDREGAFVYVNDAGCRSLGYERDELLGMHIWDVNPSSTPATWLRAWERFREQGSIHLESTHRRKDGLVFPVEIASTFVAHEGQEFLCGFAHDITDRHKTAEELRKTSQLLDSIVRNSPLAVVCLDVSGNVLMWNPAAERLFGWSEQEALGKPNPIVPAEKTAEYLSLREGVRGGQPYASQALERQRKDGTRLTLNVSSAPLHDPAGGVIGTMGVFEDITARKRVEEALRESEERFQLALRGANDGLWDWDLQTDEVYYSPRWKSMLGYAPDELEQHIETWKRLVHPDDRERTLVEVRDLLEGRRDKFEVEFRMQHKDGSLRHILSRAFLADTAAGRHKRLVGTHVDITERKRAEERLSHAQKLMQYVISHAQSAIAVHDREMRYVYVSEQYLKQYRVKEKDLIGKNHYEVFPDLPQKWRDVHQRVLAGAVEGNDEDPYVRDDGSVDWTQWECRPWYESDDSIGGLIVYTEVITERKRREVQLEQDRNLLGLIARTQLDFIKSETEAEVFGKMLEGLLSLTNSSYGFIGEVLYTDAGQPFLKTHSITNIAWNTETRKFYADHEDVGFEFFNLDTLFGSVMRTGETVVANDPAHDPRRGGLPEGHPPLNAFLGVPFTTGGRLVGMAGIANRPGGYDSGLVAHLAPFATVCANIIEACRIEKGRNAAEEKLRQSEQFVRSILDTVDEGFLVIDRDYRILTANKGYCDQVGKTRDEVIGSRCHETSHGSGRPCHEAGEECAVRLVFTTGQAHAALHRHRDQEGRVLYVETKGFPVKDASGSVVSVIETINNITEKHLLQEERLKTQKLESIGTLAGGIAHDFNNLLQGVFGYISMARMTLGQREKSLAMLEQAERALHQSVNLTTQLLTFAKGGKPVKKKTALLPVIENAVKFALSGSRSEYRIQSEPGLWLVDADAGQLGQVIQNIVLNADQSMPLGGSVVVAARNLPAAEEGRPLALKSGDYVVVTITDAGAGMPKEYFGKIFDPYFTTKEKGSGLGLATSYSIIRNHGGLIEVQSEPGKGSTFTIYLPALASVGEEPRAEAAPATTRAGRILVMDDEEIIRNVAGELLAALGHTPVLVDRGETALVAYRSAREGGQPFDAVILDLTIRGGMGGEETVGKLLEIDPDVKAIASSGYSDAATQADYRRQGFIAFLKKPYKIDELQTSLHSILA